MSAAPTGRSPLAQRLAQSCVGLRTELEVTRHLFRGEPSYVVRDPLTFETHSLTPRNYQVLVRLRADRTLGDTFEELVADRVLKPEREDDFYRFVFDLHKRNLLKLPISDETSVKERFERRRAANRTKLLMSVFSSQHALVDPSRLLEATERWVRFAFTKAFFLFWLAVVATAGVLVWLNRGELAEPFDQVLLASNLPVLWITLVTLKVLHEGGHAYACKILGGRVPEVGVNFICFTPMPYVDATAAWSFPRKLDRLIVSLAGMYVEVFIAAVAAIVWCLSEPSLLRSFAYNTAFLASVVTVGFNINPLMRFDGYYVFADLVEVPNLRAKASEATRAFFKRLLLGIPTPERRGSDRGVPHGALIVFGVSSVIYKVSLVLGIASMIALNYLVAGLLLGAIYLGLDLYRNASGLIRLLFFSQEMSGHRVRAALAGALVFLAIPAGVAMIPLPARVIAPGVLGFEHEQIVRARRAGVLREILVEPAGAVAAGEPLARLEDEALATEVRARRAELELARANERIALAGAAAGHERSRGRLHIAEEELEHSREQLDHLRLTSPLEGVVTQCLDERDLGRFLAPGTPIATVTAGSRQVRCLLTEKQLVEARPELGQRVHFRPRLRPDHDTVGRIVRIDGEGSRRVADLALTAQAGGDIALDPYDGRAAQPYFLVTIELDDDPTVAFPPGARGQILLHGESTTLGRELTRALLRFVGKVRTAG